MMRNPPYNNERDGEIRPSDVSLASIATKGEDIVRDRNLELGNASKIISLNKRYGVQQVLFNLANASYPALDTARVYKVVHCLQGTVPGAIVTLDTQGGGSVDLYPGDYYEGPLDALQLVRHADSVQAGNARIVLCKQPDANFGNLNSRAGVGGILERVTSAQSYNVTTNTPSLATDGIAITSDTGFRCVIDGTGAMPGTITGGTARYWFYDPSIAAWALSTIEYVLPTGNRYAVLPDEMISVSEGRIFVELRSLTSSLGSGVPTAYLRTYSA